MSPLTEEIWLGFWEGNSTQGEKIKGEDIWSYFSHWIPNTDLKSLKQELFDLKLKLEDRFNEIANLKIELGELFKKELKEFVKELNEGP